MIRACLTFDDGVNETWTPAILDLLRDHNAHGSFFVIGKHVEANHALTRRIVAEGHLLGNHSWSHPRLTDVSDVVVEMELWYASEEIKAAVGEYPRYWRAPYFATNSSVERIALNMGLEHVGCTLNTGDWNSSDSEWIARLVVSELREGAIVDLHDSLPPGGGSGTKTRLPTVQAVAMILETPGVKWVRVDELG